MLQTNQNFLNIRFDMEIMSIRLLKHVVLFVPADSPRSLFISPDCAFEWCCQGEKYLVLKKKYRQMLQEKEAKHPRMDAEEEQRHPSPAKPTAAAAAAVQWDARDAPTRCLQQDEPMSCAAEVKLANSYYLH